MNNVSKWVVMVLIIFMIITGTTVVAQEQVIEEDINKSVGDLEVHRETTVNGDVKLNVGAAKIWGVVNGDVSADMGEVSVFGKVNGDVKADMGKVVIDGDVTGNVSASMGEVIIEGNVGGDVKSNFGMIRVTGVVSGDVISDLGDSIISGEVGGNVKSEGKRINVNGVVAGDIELYRGIVELGPDSIVYGKIFVKEGMVRKSEGSQSGDIEIEKELTESEIDRLFTFPGGITFRGLDNITNVFREGRSWRNFNIERFMPHELVPFVQIGVMGVYGRILQKFITMVILFVLGILVYSLFPRQVIRVKEAIENDTGTVVLWGIIALLVAIPLMILLVITIIGIPLILVEILGYALAWILGYVGITYFLGGRILETAKSENDNPILKILVGVALLGLISFVPILGFLVGIAVVIIAVGASLFTRFGSTGPRESRE